MQFRIAGSLLTSVTLGSLHVLNFSVSLHRLRMGTFSEGKSAMQKVSLLSFWNSIPLSPGCLSSSPMHSGRHWAATSYWYLIIQSGGPVIDGSQTQSFWCDIASTILICMSVLTAPLIGYMGIAHVSIWQVSISLLF